MFGFPGQMPFGMNGMFPTAHPFPPPFGAPNPFGGPSPFDPTKPDSFGKVVYHYNTPDGGPPADGRPPVHGFGASAGLGMANSFMPGMGGSFFPHAGPPPPYYARPPPSACPPGFVSVPSQSQAAAVVSRSTSTPPPPPSSQSGPSHSNMLSRSTDSHFLATNKRETPLTGNRVKGQLIKTADGCGVIYPRDSIMLHIFTHNLVNKFPPSTTNPTMIFVPNTNTISKDFTAQHVPCSMRLRELIEAADCKARANAHPPYNQPGFEYPDDNIGLQELTDLGDGWWSLGSKITLGEDSRANLTVGDVWGNRIGEAGGEQVKWVIRCPV